MSEACDGRSKSDAIYLDGVNVLSERMRVNNRGQFVREVSTIGNSFIKQMQYPGMSFY